MAKEEKQEAEEKAGRRAQDQASKAEKDEKSTRTQIQIDKEKHKQVLAQAKLEGAQRVKLGKKMEEEAKKKAQILELAHKKAEKAIKLIGDSKPQAVVQTSNSSSSMEQQLAEA